MIIRPTICSTLTARGSILCKLLLPRYLPQFSAPRCTAYVLSSWPQVCSNLFCSKLGCSLSMAEVATCCLRSIVVVYQVQRFRLDGLSTKHLDRIVGRKDCCESVLQIACLMQPCCRAHTMRSTTPSGAWVAATCWPVPRCICCSPLLALVSATAFGCCPFSSLGSSCPVFCGQWQCILRCSFRSIFGQVRQHACRVSVRISSLFIPAESEAERKTQRECTIVLPAGY